MPAVSISRMMAAEESARNAGWTEAALLSLAGTRLGHAIGRHHPVRGTAIAYLGKGHNAGDALVALKVLRDIYGWEVRYRLSTALDQCAPLVVEKAQDLGHDHAMDHPPVIHDIPRPLLLLDGLLGTGGMGGIRRPMLELAREMHDLRNRHGAHIAAVDLPSGIDADSGEAAEESVVADTTFMIGNPKQGLLLGRACNHTGALALVPVECLTVDEPADLDLIAPQTMHFGKAPRPFDFHKGMAGRVSLLVGSARYAGAAVLAATGAVKGGAGLVTLHLPKGLQQAVAARCPPEVILREYNRVGELWEVETDAWVIGCGLGPLPDPTAEAVLDWLEHLTCPTVLDADALNLVAGHIRLHILKANHLLTPHPGEFRRLAGDLADQPREQAARDFVERHRCTLLLKGARTVIASPGQPLWCNATGTPGMAGGGQGDLLAGVIGSQLAAGLPPHEAAALAAWSCGRAAEIAVTGPARDSERSLTPSDCARQLSAAFHDWRDATR